MLEFTQGPPRDLRTKTVSLRPPDFDDVENLVSNATNFWGTAVIKCDQFATPVAWNPHQVRLQDSVIRVVIQGTSENFHPDNSALALLTPFPGLEEVQLNLTSAAVFRLFTTAFVQICNSERSCVHAVDLLCHASAIDEDVQTGIIEDLRLCLPCLTKAAVSFNCSSLSERFVREVLPLGIDLTGLAVRCHTSDQLLSVLASEVFQRLREVRLNLALDKMPRMDLLAQAIRSHSSLRRLEITGVGGYDRVLVEAILENPTIVYVTYQEPTLTMDGLLQRISRDDVVYPRNIQCCELPERGLLMKLFPRNPGLLGWFNTWIHGQTAVNLSPANLASLAGALRDPACALKNICGVFPPDQVVSSAARGFFSSVRESTSLQSVSLSGLTFADALVDVLRGNVHLKKFECTDNLSISNDDLRDALVEAVVANETIEVYHILGDALWQDVSSRNIALCVKHCRLLWISWVTEWASHVRFELALVCETIEMADLSWSETDRLKHQLRFDGKISNELEAFKNRRLESTRGRSAEPSRAACSCS